MGFMRLSSGWQVLVIWDKYLYLWGSARGIALAVSIAAFLGVDFAVIFSTVGTLLGGVLY
jgi:hypothetical protein